MVQWQEWGLQRSSLKLPEHLPEGLIKSWLLSLDFLAYPFVWLLCLALFFCKHTALFFLYICMSLQVHVTSANVYVYINIYIYIYIYIQYIYSIYIYIQYIYIYRNIFNIYIYIHRSCQCVYSDAYIMFVDRLDRLVNSKLGTFRMVTNGCIDRSACMCTNVHVLPRPRPGLWNQHAFRYPGFVLDHSLHSAIYSLGELQ